MTVADRARRLNSRHPAGTRLPALILLSDVIRTPDPCGAAAALPPGSAVILRHYGAPNRTELALALMKLRRRRRFRLLIASDWRLAVAVGADGVHLPEREAYRAIACRRRPDWLITVAAHSQAALRKAEAARADAVLLSPVFSTQSHPGARTLGPARFARLVLRSKIPVYALGGVDARHAGRIVGAVGLAGISGIAPPDSPFPWRNSVSHIR